MLAEVRLTLPVSEALSSWSPGAGWREHCGPTSQPNSPLHSLLKCTCPLAFGGEKPFHPLHMDWLVCWCEAPHLPSHGLSGQPTLQCGFGSQRQPEESPNLPTWGRVLL